MLPVLTTTTNLHAVIKLAKVRIIFQLSILEIPHRDMVNKRRNVLCQTHNSMAENFDFFEWISFKFLSTDYQGHQAQILSDELNDFQLLSLFMSRPSLHAWLSYCMIQLVSYSLSQHP